jgi:hypothetical protein
MATGTAGSDAHYIVEQEISFIRKNFTFASGETVITVGKIAAGAIILGPISGVQLVTVFNDTTGSAMSIGVSGTAAKYAAALDLKTAVTFLPLDVTDAARRLTADETIIATVANTDDDGTTGEGEIVICFVADVDN